MKENDFEKDIKIIESIVEEYESCSVPEIDMQVDVTFGKEQNSALKHILSDYKKVVNELKKYKNMYEAEHEIHKTRNEQLERKENSIQSALKLKNKFEELKLKLKDKDKEIKQLKEDIKKMYDEEVIISILGDEFNISRNEALSLLEGEKE